MDARAVTSWEYEQHRCQELSQRTVKFRILSEHAEPILIRDCANSAAVRETVLIVKTFIRSALNVHGVYS